jgi:hypothetical protein
MQVFVVAAKDIMACVGRFKWQQLFMRFAAWQVSPSIYKTFPISVFAVSPAQQHAFEHVSALVLSAVCFRS